MNTDNATINDIIDKFRQYKYTANKVDWHRIAILPNEYSNFKKLEINIYSHTIHITFNNDRHSNITVERLTDIDFDGRFIIFKLHNLKFLALDTQAGE